MLSHHLASRLHLVGEIWIIRREFDSIGSIRDKKDVALLNLEANKNIFGENYADRTSNREYLCGSRHSGLRSSIITISRTWHVSIPLRLMLSPAATEPTARQA